MALIKPKETLLLCHCERSLRSAAISSVARGDRHAEKASARISKMIVGAKDKELFNNQF